MNLPIMVILADLNRGRELIDSLLRQTKNSRERVALLAELLRSLWPSAPLYTAQLRDSGATHFCVLDETGSQRPDWVEILDIDSDRPAETGGRHSKLPLTLQLPDHDYLRHSILCDDVYMGNLGLALPSKASAEMTAVVQ